MFHANSWGLPYGAVMLGVKLVFPGPHLHPDDLLDLMQLEPPTLALGVPTIWMGLIQAYERSLVEQPGRWKLPAGMRSLVGGAAVPEALIRAFAEHGIYDRAGLGHDRDLAAGQRLVPAARAAGRAATTSASAAPRMAGVPVPLVECASAATTATSAVGRQERRRDPVRGPFITGSYHEVPRRATTSSPTTAGCAPATSRRWTSSASCASPTAPRT